jgi:hypothetical protein
MLLFVPFPSFPEEVAREAERLRAVCAERGVEAALAEACACPKLLEALAEACHRSGLVAAGQYLTYLTIPYD